jgi:hypothetical protein
LAMGACLTNKQTDPWSVYMGIPAKKAEIGSMDANAQSSS